MLLEIGKKYITSNGAIVTVESLLENADHYAFNCTIRDATGYYQKSVYTPSGYYWSDQRDHKWNIVSEATFKLKAGKRYKSRSGFVTTPLIFNNETETLYKFIGTVEGITRTWTEEGIWMVTSSEEELDLIEEYIGEKYSGIKLEVGVKYLTRSGSVITLFDHNDNGLSFMGSNNYIYTLGYRGFVFYDEESEGDIIGLAPEPLEEVNVDDMARDFDSQWEIWKWLVEGFKIISKDTKIIYWFDKGKIKANDGSGERDTINIFSDINAYEKYQEPPKWDEFKIKDKVLCRVENSAGAESVVLVKHFNGTFYIDINDKEWLFANPISLDDITKYIWECE
jgi:hypothetical protein